MKMQLKQELIAAVKKEDFKTIQHLIDEQPKKAKTNTPPVAIKIDFIKVIEQNAAPSIAFNIGKYLYKTGSAAELEIGIILLADSYAEDKSYVLQALHDASVSENWEVREWAAEAIAIVLIKDYQYVMDVLKTWMKEDSNYLKRAIAVAIRYASKTIDSKHADEMLDLMEQLLANRDEYIRKNLGPYTIGDGLLKHYPSHVLKRLKKWSEDMDEQVRWNVAMTFTSAASLKYSSDGLAILKVMEEDERPFVKRAVQKAKKNLLKD